MKRMIALLLALVMVLGLAACGAKEEANAPAATEANAPAATEGGKLEEYKLVYYMPGDPQADEALVEEAINEYLKDTLNIKLDIVMVPFGDMEEKFRVAVGSGEQIDVVFTSGWSNDFYGNVTRNAFLPLNDLLPTYGADVLAQLPDCWGSCTIDGNIYAVPNEQIWPYQQGLAVSTAVLEEYGWDISNIKTQSDLTAMLAEYKADHPESAPLYAGAETELWAPLTWNTYEQIDGTAMSCVVKMDDETCTVLNSWEPEYWAEQWTLAKEWYDAGYVREDILTMDLYAAALDMANGKSIMATLPTYSPGVEVTMESTYQTDLTVVTVGYESPIMIGGSIIATMNAIPVTSKNPERAMMFINAMNTDPVLYNLLCFGIEGTHYTLDGTCATSVENSGWNPNADWAYGCQFNAYTRPGQEADVWEQTRAINAAAVPSVLMGFVFDTEPVKNQIAAVSAVDDEYRTQLGFSPVSGDDLMQQYIADMTAAGAVAIKEEAQRQINEWLATK